MIPGRAHLSGDKPGRDRQLAQQDAIPGQIVGPDPNTDVYDEQSGPHQFPTTNNPEHVTKEEKVTDGHRKDPPERIIQSPHNECHTRERSNGHRVRKRELESPGSLFVHRFHQI